MNEHLLKQAIHKDLHWIVNAPSLLAEHPLLWSPERLKTLNFQSISLDIAALTKVYQSKLGHYFETLVGILFATHPEFQILAENHVIRNDKTTLGELDLLVRDTRTDEIIHLELALKFYLQVPEVNTAELAWVGAGLKDFFHQKLNRLYHHQLQLPQLARELGCWPSDLPYPDRHALWMPGRLYVAEHQRSEKVSGSVIAGTPWQLNPDTELSYWRIAPDAFTDLDWQALKKADWLRNRPETDGNGHLPAQFHIPGEPMPVYVLPAQWQTRAHESITRYLATL